MPYIKPEERVDFASVLDKLPAFESKGQLEYCIFVLMLKYMVGRAHNYSNMHDCAYAAQHCCDEFRRRFLDARENFALEQNGDIDAYSGSPSSVLNSDRKQS